MTRKIPGGQTSGMRSRNTANRPRQGVASKELQEARRRRRQREVMRNRIIFGVVCALLLALLIFLIVKLFGFIAGSSSRAETSTITFNSDGSVVFEEVVDFDTEVYSKSELKDYVKDSISSFNETYGDEAIELNKVSVSDNKTYVKTTYKDAETYSAATSCQTYNDTYESALEAGYDFNTLYSIITDTTATESQNVDTDTTFAGKKVVVVNENVTVVVPGTVEYVSDSNFEVVSTNTIKISPVDGNEDSTSLVYIIYTAE